MFSGRSLLLVLLFAPHAGFGQFMTASGGASSVMDAYGVKFDYRYAPFAGWLGVGYDRGCRFGSMTGATSRGTDLVAGDRFYSFLLDTDVFDRSYYFDARGLSVSRHNKSESWTAFVGATASEFSASFVRTFQTQQAAGAFFLPAQVRAANHAPLIQCLKPRTNVDPVGGSPAVTSNWETERGRGELAVYHAMFSVATEYKSKWLTLASSWTRADDRFQRLHVSNPVFSERRGANVEARFTPIPHLSLTLAHEKIAPPVTLAPASPRVSAGLRYPIRFGRGIRVQRQRILQPEREPLRSHEVVHPVSQAIATIYRLRLRCAAGKRQPSANQPLLGHGAGKDIPSPYRGWNIMELRHGTFKAKAASSTGLWPEHGQPECGHPAPPAQPYLTRWRHG